MTAITYRMAAGACGEVTTTHPASIRPRLNDATTPIASYGLAGLYNGASNDIRGMQAGDQGSSAISIAGIAVRPYPTQVSTSVNPLSTVGYSTTPGAAPSGQIIDVLEQGSILVPIVGTPNLGATVYVWCAASTGSHIQGGFEASSSGGNTVPVANAYFGGGVDASGVGEVILRGNP